MAKRITLDLDFDFGDKAFVVTDPDQTERIVTGMKILPGYQVIYELSLDNDIDYHYGFELSDEEDVSKRIKHM